MNVGIDEANHLDKPSENTPVYISTWLYLECDILDPQNNQRMQCQNKTYFQALKMRAAISFHYNKLGRGNNSWHQARGPRWIFDWQSITVKLCGTLYIEFAKKEGIVSHIVEVEVIFLVVNDIIIFG